MLLCLLLWRGDKKSGKLSQNKFLVSKDRFTYRKIFESKIFECYFPGINFLFWKMLKILDLKKNMMKSKDCCMKRNKTNIFTVINRRQKPNVYLEPCLRWNVLRKTLMAFRC